MFIIFYLSLWKTWGRHRNPSLSLSLCCCHNFFCPPIKCQWPDSCPSSPHLNWQHIQTTSFSSVGLCFMKLGACWGSNRISLPFKLQLQMCCHWVRPSLHSPYFPNSVLDLTLFDYNMAPTDRNYVSSLEWFQLHLFKLGSSHFCEEKKQ